MNTVFSILRARASLLGLIVLAMTLAGCVVPAPVVAPAQAPAATAAPTIALAATSAPTIAPATMGTKVMLAQNADLGEFLADEKGMTLYLFTKDEKNVSNCYDKCEVAWPVLHTGGAPEASAGVNASLLGTTTRTDGTTQVTYNGWPLYYYVKDQKPGDVTGQEVGDVWYVISPQGEKIEVAQSESTAAPTAGAAQRETVRVDIKDFSFGAPLTVKLGTTVEWTNQDSAPHTVTASDDAFDSGAMNQNATYSFTFTKAGTYDYICKYHSMMKGQVIVTE